MPDTPLSYFKDLCGEFCTATSFALWLGASIVKRQIVPDWVERRGNSKEVKTILIANQYLGKNYSFILLRKA
jgi:hypothetical protein